MSLNIIADILTAKDVENVEGVNEVVRAKKRHYRNLTLITERTEVIFC